MATMKNDGLNDLIDNPGLYLALGIAGLFFGFFFLLVGGIVGTGTGFGTGFFLCAALGLVPGFIFIAQVFRIRNRERELESLGEVLKVYRRIQMAEIARKLGVAEFQAEKMVASAIDRGYVEGYVDRNTREFFTVESISQAIPLENCPRCGAPREKLYLTGEQVKCSACDSVLQYPEKQNNAGREI